MYRLDDGDADLTAEKRCREVAGILAPGVLRLRSRAALLGVLRPDPGPENLPDSVPNCLEVSSETVLSVHTG
jgi:hypothetical protein